MELAKLWVDYYTKWSQLADTSNMPCGLNSTQRGVAECQSGGIVPWLGHRVTIVRTEDVVKAPGDVLEAIELMLHNSTPNTSPSSPSRGRCYADAARKRAVKRWAETSMVCHHGGWLHLRLGVVHRHFNQSVCLMCTACC